MQTSEHSTSSGVIAFGRMEPETAGQVCELQYRAICQAYDWFNAVLFEGCLPPVFITLAPGRPRTGGHFGPERWALRTDLKDDRDDTTAAIGELNLNPRSWTGRSVEWILSVLVHEMAHVWQQHFGKPPRGGYHDREWGRKMKSVGLHPSATSQEGGRETGVQMSHYIVTGGPFSVQVARLLEKQGDALRWLSLVEYKARPPKSKFLYECTNAICSLGPSAKSKDRCRAWAKAGLTIICGNCGEFLVMESEDEDADED